MKIIVKNSHFKIIYEKNEEYLRPIIKEKFTFRDLSLEKTWEVKQGLKKPFTSFYIDEFDLLPTGFLPFCKVFLKKENIDFQVFDQRKFPEPDYDFLNSTMEIKGLDGNIYIPRYYQVEALKEVVKRGGGCIQMATGLGKGFVIALICRVFPKAKILNLFDRVSLINQTEKAFLEKYGFTSDEIGVIQGKRIETDKRIILLSLMSYENAFSVFPEIDIIIGDEAHSTMRSETAEKIINSCQNASIKIGISATIDKIYNPYEQAKLYSFAGPIIYNKDIDEGIKESALSDGEVYFIKYNSEPKEMKDSYQDIYKTSKLHEFNFKSIVLENNQLKVKNKVIVPNLKKEDLDRIEQVKMLGNKEKENELYNEIFNSFVEESLKLEGWEIIKKNGEKFKRKFLEFGNESLIYIENEIRNNIIKFIAERESQNGRRTVILFSKIRHGEKLHKMLPNSLFISGIDSEERRNEVERYVKENKNAIVIVSTIWQTGKDIPELESFINATGGRSAIALIQKIGRLTRKSDKTGKKQFYFYDFIDDHINPIARKQTQERIKTVKNLNLKMKIINFENKF